MRYTSVKSTWGGRVVFGEPDRVRELIERARACPNPLVVLNGPTGLVWLDATARWELKEVVRAA